MKMIDTANNPVYAMKCFIKGLKLVIKPGLRQYVLIPIFINFILYSLAFYLGYIYISDLIAKFIPSWLSWMEWLIWPLFYMIFSMIGFFTFTMFANLIASPFYSQLAAKTLLMISGQPVQVKQQSINQVVLAELKKVIYLFTRMLPLLILFVVPGINLIAPFLWILFAAWGMGLEFLAYPLENKGLLFTEQKRLGKARRIGFISLGGFIIVGLTIPLLNIFIAPAAVIGATIYEYGLSENESL